MASSGPRFFGMLRDSIATPYEAAQALLALRPSTMRIVEAAILVSVVDALIVGVLAGGAFTIPLPEGDMTLGPLAHAALLAASFLLSAGALQVGGQILGGKGRFEQSLLVVVWLEVIAVAIQFLQLISALIVPPLAPILGIAGLLVLFWCLIHFTRALHGFTGYGRPILAVVLGAFLVGIAVSLLVGLLGFGGPPNV